MGRQVYEKGVVMVTTDPVAVSQAANQYKCVDVDGELAGSTGTGAYGILQNSPVVGEVSEVAVGGISKAIAGATVTAGAYLTNEGTTGHVIPATGTNRIIGRAVTAGADTELISMLVIPHGGINAAA